MKNILLTIIKTIISPSLEGQKFLPVLLLFFIMGLTTWELNRNVYSSMDMDLKNRSQEQAVRKTSLTGGNISSIITKKYNYSEASVADLAFMKVVFSKFNIYFSPDTLTRLRDDNYIKHLSEDKFKGGRTARWYFAWSVFKDYPWYKKIFGGGFDYLEMFGKKFGEAKYDWPHNPMISAFLYSGILGGFVFLWFLMMVIVNYLLYLRMHFFFFICFIVTFFFVFFSDTSLFNTPLFTFLCIVPFFTKYLHMIEKYNDIQKVPFRKILFW
jgi:hypothetical protein